MILTVLMEPKSSLKDLSINTSYVLRWSVLVKISGKLVDNYKCYKHRVGLQLLLALVW